MAKYAIQVDICVALVSNCDWNIWVNDCPFWNIVMFIQDFCNFDMDPNPFKYICSIPFKFHYHYCKITSTAWVDFGDQAKLRSTVDTYPGFTYTIWHCCKVYKTSSRWYIDDESLFSWYHHLCCIDGGDVVTPSWIISRIIYINLNISIADDTLTMNLYLAGTIISAT